ncbi:DUF262 domain-containing protein [Eubacterium sp. AF17-7]|uniref:DUF262 domain-containing protein n=1 Tax=Eubacterium sp. AF17-7 TaxID=2293105 RepID=UPI0018F4F6CA|nr:DUF262 domain-containing protein [Eubacterium sp. AF17-7]
MWLLVKKSINVLNNQLVNFKKLWYDNKKIIKTDNDEVKYMNNSINANEEVEYNVNIQLAENEEVVNDEKAEKDNYEKKRELLEATKIVKQTWSILEIYQKIQGNKLLLNPEYQRNVIWDKSKKTAFIESLFMGIIIPPIYVVEVPGENILEENSYEVVDGKQRLSTIKSFIQNKFVLEEKSLEYYKDWFGGQNFSTIQEQHSTLTNEMLSSVLDIYVITANSPEFTKYDIFSRLNKGAEKLKVNEIRKAVYHSEALKFIEDYVRENVDSANYKLVFSKNDIKRYEDYGRFYRSIAYYVCTDENENKVLGYNSRPREMINDVLFKLQTKDIILSQTDILKIIEQTIQLLIRFSSNSYKQYLVDACIHYAVLNPQKIMEKSDEIEKDDVINESLIKSPSTTTNVNSRIKRVHEIINS